MALSGVGNQPLWSVSKLIGSGDATITLVAAPAAGVKIVVQEINWIVTTAAAQTYVFGDGTISLFQSPTSHAVGWYGLDFGEPGILLTAATAFSFIPSAAGYVLSISAYGYYAQNPTKAYHT